MNIIPSKWLAIALTFWCLLMPTFAYLQVADTIFINDNFEDEYFAAKCLHYSQKEEIIEPNNPPYSIEVNEKNYRLQTDQYNVLKVIVKNNSSIDKKYLLFLHNVQIDRADVLLYQNNKLVYQSMPTGCRIARTQRPNAHRTLALPVMFKSLSTYEMYIRVYRKEFGITVSPHLVEPVKGINFRWTDISFLIVILSCCFLAILGMAMHYHSKVKKLNQNDTLLLIIYSILTALYVMAAGGYGSLYIWGKYPNFEVNAAILFGALSGSAFMYLCKVILKIEQWSKWLARWFDLVSILYILVSFLGFYLYSDVLPKGLFGSLLSLFYLLVIFNMIVIIGIVLKKILIDKESVYYWFLFIFIFYIIYTVLVIALEIGVIRYNFEIHAIRLVTAHFPQLILLLVFIIKRMILTIDANQDILTNMRKEITQDIHDDLGTTLTKISLQSHMAALKFADNDHQAFLFQKIENFSVEANNKLRTFLLSISPKYDTYDFLIQSMKDIFLKHSNNSTNKFTAQEIPNNPKISYVLKNNILKEFDELFFKLNMVGEISHMNLTINQKDTSSILCSFYIDFLNSVNYSIIYTAVKELKENHKKLFGINIENDKATIDWIIFIKNERT